MEPIPEAVAWAERADAWAQTPPENGSGELEPSRWSQVAPTGRPSVPAEGVGWRTETAEWRAAEQTARWRQTTEWRSTSGTHGWRSVTEAWHTGAGAENFQPPVDSSGRQPLAISGTAWPTPSDDASGSGEIVESGQAWQQSSDNPDNGASPQVTRWQRFTDGTPPWQAGDARPAWQQFTAPPAPWEQAAAGTPPWQPPAEPQRAIERPESSWQQLIEPTPSWQRGDPTPPARPPERGGWQSLTGPAAGPGAGEPASYTRSGGFDDGRHLVREDDRARWRDAANGMAGPGETTRSGRRRAAEPGSRTGSGTGWAARSDADNWAGHADTGSIHFGEPRTNGSAWGARAEAPSWRDGRETDDPPSRRSGGDWRTRADSGRAEPDSGSWSRGDEPRTDGWRRSAEAAPGWQDDRDTPRGRRDEPDAPGWRRDDRDAPGWQRDDRDTPGWQRDDRDTPGWQRDDRDTRSWQRDGGSGRERRRDFGPPADPWAQSAADSGVFPAAWQEPETDTGSWRTDTGFGERTRPSNPNRRRADDGGTRGGRRRAEPDDDAPLDPEVWRREPGSRGGANWPEDEPRRRAADADKPRWASEGQRSIGWAGPEQRSIGSRPEPRSIGWSGQEPADDWRGGEPPAVADWRRDLRDDDDDGPPVGDAVTEVRQRIDPVMWDRDEPEPPARGTASYRGGNTGDWRRDLAAENTELADGESRRFGTQDFVPFRPSGSAAVPTSPPVAAATPAPMAAETNGARQELLVGSTAGAARAEPLGGQWPPRQPTGYQSPAAGGSYERRAMGTGLATAPSRQSNLLEPDEDEIEEDTGGPLAAVGYTVIWYGVPVVLFVLYMLFLNGSQQAHALSTLAGAAPQFGLSLVLSMVVAVGLRWASGTWKAASVGLAAAVMGGGLATVLTSAITGNSLS